MESSQKHGSWRRLLHLFAGGIGATLGQCVTCPLDVVQTRLQSTHLNFSNLSTVNAVVGNSVIHIPKPIIGISYFQILYAYMKHMIHNEGLLSLFKGLSPSLVGIVPAKSIYFFCYASAKSRLNESPVFHKYHHVVHSLSAVLAGGVTGTVTNPVWYIKTKMQLKQDHRRQGIMDVMKEGYHKHGMRCFFRGLSASYVGVFETVIYFLLYEDLKKTLNLNNRKHSGENFQALHLIFAATSSKLIATMLMYPHEVVRTRLRQDVQDVLGRLKYRNFFQTLYLVGKEEGRSGLYGGFGTSLIRQVPNTMVTFLVYEAIIFLIEKD